VLRTFDVEADRPSLDEARRRVTEEIRQARAGGAVVLKVIHGYGSSGKGGALRVGLRRSFARRVREGAIRGFVAGEDFTIFDATVLQMLDACPALRRDPDLGASNPGVTFVWLR
jgi:hypothetical protein